MGSRGTNSTLDPVAHEALIVDQFNRQSATFAQRHGHSDLLDRLLQMAEVTSADTVLDVGCGPGIVACAFARVAQHVTGLDLAPRMLEQAKARQAQQSLTNMTWVRGDVARMPFADNSFSIVVSRYTFHHFLSPAEVLAEMKRVCRPGGRMVIADVTPAPEKLTAYDEFETLRDPSHAHALSVEDMESLVSRAGLAERKKSSYLLEMDFADLMSGSFPNPENVERIWELLRGDVGRDSIGLSAARKDGKYFVSFPTTIIAGIKSACKGKA